MYTQQQRTGGFCEYTIYASFIRTAIRPLIPLFYSLFFGENCPLIPFFGKISIVNFPQ